MLVKQVLYSLSYSSILLWLFLEEEGGSRTACLSLPWTTIFPVSASQVARITGVGLLCLASYISFLICDFCLPSSVSMNSSPPDIAAISNYSFAHIHFQCAINALRYRPNTIMYTVFYNCSTNYLRNMHVYNFMLHNYLKYSGDL
jgi:hypothetical protein